MIASCRAAGWHGSIYAPAGQVTEQEDREEQQGRGDSTRERASPTSKLVQTSERLCAGIEEDDNLLLLLLGDDRRASQGKAKGTRQSIGTHGAGQGAAAAHREPGAPAGDLLQAPRRAAQEGPGALRPLRRPHRHHHLLRTRQALRPRHHWVRHRHCLVVFVPCMLCWPMMN